ncbi:MAG: tetratricopeptide repeat protein, partial [Bacteroidales bacterium]|nr:tetratricopeptide repeat protein [Bacteroidales bacterium]
MATTKTNAQEENLNQGVAETVSNVETFLKDNGKTLGWAAGLVVVIVLAVFAYTNWVMAPAREKAKGEAFAAEAYFQKGDYETALSGDGNCLGLADVIDQYGSKAGKGIYFEAGACQLQLKNYTEALNYFKKYKGSDKLLKARSLCCIGDCYAGLDDLAQALASYKAAASASDNILAAGYLLKAGITAEALGLPEEALGYYKSIKNKYPASVEA